MRTAKQWLGFFVIHLYPKRDDAGIRAMFTDLDADRDACAARIKEALGVLSSAQRRHRSLLARIRYIVVWSGDYCFADDFGGIHLPSDAITGVTTHALASILVHEATHIRLSDMGVTYAPKYRERIETLCIREQATFLRAAPNNPDDPEDMARAAESVLKFPWWSEAERQANRDRVLEENRVPQWLRSVVRG